jgi:hypothetical protein
LPGSPLIIVIGTALGIYRFAKNVKDSVTGNEQGDQVLMIRNIYGYCEIFLIIDKLGEIY